jgi:hypothetical protein
MAVVPFYSRDATAGEPTGSVSFVGRLLARRRAGTLDRDSNSPNFFWKTVGSKEA